MIDRLRDMPSGTEVADWLSHVSRTANLNPHIIEEWTAVDRRPALRVRYQHLGGTEGETLFIVDSPRTFEISFTSGWLKYDHFYAVHRQIVSTFAFTSDDGLTAPQ